MKRITLIIIAAILGCMTIKSATLTPQQEKAKKEIFSALQKYGTRFTDYGETIQFMYNEANFEASVHTLNPQTLYLTLGIIFFLDDKYKPEISNIAAYNAAADKPVCSFSTNGLLCFSCEMYAKQAKPFIDVLPEMLAALISSAEKFSEEYEKASKEYGASNIFSVESNNNEFVYPKCASNGDSKLYIEKVTLGSNYTILDMVSYNRRQYQWCSISKNSYISANGKHYPLSRAEGIAYAPQHTDYPGYESGREVSLRFRLFFPALPTGTTSFDFSEGTESGWRIKGVELKHGKSFAINGETIETSDHKWACTAIEIQDGQTIVTKTVQPKQNNTYMYSSQDEYIEDADTGRKYYLLNSSIGFEGSPELSFDTKTLTFYEVYPVLPSSVKRINISSGEQYYVKGLKIR